MTIETTQFIAIACAFGIGLATGFVVYIALKDLIK